MRTSTRLGLLAYSTNTGLGIQTWEFAEHMRPDRLLLVDLSRLNKVETHHERYAAFECVRTRGFPTAVDVSRFLGGLDAVFVCETPLNYELFAGARRRGVKTVLQPNHEFNDYYQRDLPLPDLFGLPSCWHYDDLPHQNKRLLPVPVAAERFTQRHCGAFRRFLHVAGRPAVHDRNGTFETIAALRRVAGDVTLTIRVQGGGDNYRAAAAGDERITVDSAEVFNYWEAYDGFDCLVLPRKYGGLCLPMQEALAAGLPVIMTDVSPNETELPAEWLVPAVKTGQFMTRSMLDIHTADVEALAAKMQEFADCCTPSSASETAVRLGRERSWENLVPLYRQTFEGLVA